MMYARIRACRVAISRLGLLGVMAGFAATSRADMFSVTNLVTDDQGVNSAKITDPFLKNPWGISHSASSPFWVSDNGTGVSTLYKVDPNTNAVSMQGLVVTIPGSGNPTGQAFNSASGSGAFNKDNFLFVSEDGTISGWHGALGTAAEILQLPTASNVYKGTTLESTGGHSYLLSANFHTGNIDVLKGDASAPDLGGTFTDPATPNHYAPFNIQFVGNRIYVTYALQGAGNDDAPVPATVS